MLVNLKLRNRNGFLQLAILFFLGVLLTGMASIFGFADQEKVNFTKEDWFSVVKTYEAQIADGRPTTSALHNLALARFKLEENSQAIAVWLAAMSLDPRDAEIGVGLEAALTKVGLSKQSLVLDAHGPWQSWVVSQGQAGLLTFLRIAFACLVVTVLMIAAATLQYFLRGVLVGRIAVVGLALSLIVTSALWSFVYAFDQSVGYWGAVVEDTDIAAKEKPDDNSATVSKIQMGSPIYSIGPTTGAWIYLLNADGVKGWVPATSVRVIRVN